MTHHVPFPARAIAATVLLASALLVPSTASAQSPGSGQPSEAAAAPDLAVTFTGPSEAVAGSTADWTLTVRNLGTAAAPRFGATTDLPDGVSVLSSGTAEGWTCVLGTSVTPEGGSTGGDLLCFLEAGLAAGAQAPELPVRLAYASTGAGAREIAATVSRADGEPEGALANNRFTQTTLVNAPPADSASTPASAPVLSVPLSGPAVVSPNPITATPAATPASAAIPAGLPFTGIDGTTGMALGAAMVLLGGLLVRAGRLRLRAPG